MLSADGNTMVVNRATNSDGCYVFTRIGTSWNLQSKLIPNHASGIVGIKTIQISRDGKLIATHSLLNGSPRSNAIDFFQYSNGAWSTPTSPTSIIVTGTLGQFASRTIHMTKDAQGHQSILALYFQFFTVFSRNGPGYDPAFQQRNNEYHHNVHFNMRSDHSGNYVMIGNAYFNKVFVLWRASTNPTEYQSIQNFTMADGGFGNCLDLSGDGRLAIVGQSTAMPSSGLIYFYERRPRMDVCKPKNGVNKATCKRQISSCAAEGIQVKWAGLGCRRKARPRVVGDGGCQCKGYCGYSCKKACNKDKECTWKEGACHVKSSGKVGTTMNICY